jgi:bifunctional non-homologous end joining protein LigD
MEEHGTVDYLIADNAATLLYLADQACITLHRFLSKADRLRRPDRLVFDLDPAGEDFAAVRHAAKLLHELLDELGLPSALMTTGSRGLHVLVPLIRDADVDDVRAFARAVADLLSERHPDRLTTEPSKKARGDRLYLDVQRNGYAQTAVAPYAVRALPGAPVATPLTWPELDEKATNAQRWTMANIHQRLQEDDPWDGALRHGHSLTSAAKRLKALWL